LAPTTVRRDALILNIVLAVFNLFPLPPLDGGRILVGILPKAIAGSVASLEPYGLAILIGLLIILPMLGAQLGIDLNFLSHLIAIATVLLSTPSSTLPVTAREA
jgi:Zn-dependent protease